MAMAAVAAVFDGSSSVRRRSMALVMDYDERTRGREGGARIGNATTSQHDERTRGWCNKRTTRDDGATTSWRNETTRGGTTRRQDNKRAARREATQQPAGAARGREGGAGRKDEER
jgi:hypothetical protein